MMTDLAARAAFVGRDAECAALRAARTDPAVRAAFVLGPAGVGKTRLLREAAADAVAAGFSVLWMTASATAATIPFGALVQALPTLEGAVGFQVLREATRRVDEAAAKGPVAIFVDDAKHLDDPSTAVVVHLALVGRAFVVASWRTGPGEPPAPGDSWRDVAAQIIELAPFRAPESGRLIEALVEGAVPAALTTSLHRLSRGNPLFLTELVLGGLRGRHLRDDGTGWHWSGRLEFTPRLLDVIGGRLDDASPTTRALVDLLAYSGPLPTGLLADVGTRTADLLGAEREGLARSVATDRGVEIELAHPLFGELARSRLSLLARRELARRLFTAAEARHDVDPLRAATWLLDAESSTSAQVLTVAAQRAFGTFDLRLATRLARAAVDRGDPRARVVLAQLLMESGDCAQAANLLATMVAEMPDSGTTAEDAWLCALHAWVVAHGLHDLAAAQEALRAADERVGCFPDVLAATRAHLSAYAGCPDDAVAQSDIALGTVGAHPLSIIRAWTARSYALILAGRLEESISAGEMASTHYRDVLGEAWSDMEEERSGSLAMPRIYAGRLDEAAEIADRRLELSTLANWSSSVAAWTIMVATIELYRGQVTSARHRLRSVERLEYGGRHPYAPCTRRMHGQVLVLALAQAGRADEAATELARLGEPSSWFAATGLWAGSGRSWVLAAQGCLVQATRLALADADRADSAGMHGWAVIALHQGVRFGHAPLVADRLAALRDVVSGDLPELYIDHGAAAVARHPARLRELADGYGALGLRLLQAETLAQAATAYDALGRMREAASARTEAVAWARICEDARTPLLQGLRHDEELTPREHEIARLAWAGLSSRGIAERLTISTRTVDNTLGHAYRKLGIDGRRGLADYFGQQSRP